MYFINQFREYVFRCIRRQGHKKICKGFIEIAEMRRFSNYECNYLQLFSKTAESSKNDWKLLGEGLW